MMKKGTFGKGRANKWEAMYTQKKENDQNSSTLKTFDENATYIMSVHPQDNYSGADIVFNPDIFPNIKLHDKLLISDLEGNHLILQVQKESFANELRTKNFNLSICKNLAENYDMNFEISNKINVKLKMLEDVKNYELDTVEITFKDQVIYRRDLYKLEKRLIGTCLYTSKIISYEGVKGKVYHMISKAGDLIHSGIVTDKTKFVFRTLSSRYYILIEISKEMCDFNINGELYLEKTMKAIKALLQRMETSHTHHKLVFILSARLYYPQFKDLKEAQSFIAHLTEEKEEELNRLSTNCTTFQVDTRGKIFQDVYHRVNTREVKRDWENILYKIKETIFAFLRYINWKINASPQLKTLINPASVIDTRKQEKPQLSPHPDIFIDKPSAAQVLEKSAFFAGVSPHLEVPNFDGSSPHMLSRSSSQHQVGLNESTSDVDVLEQNNKDFFIPVECELASSEYSNLLESLNLALSMYNHHQLSRTLTTTGHTVAILSAGEGKYFVDPNLARLTKECMALGRVYCNLITLREDIPTTQPLFVYQENPENYYADLNNDETKDLLSFEKLAQDVQSQMVSTDSMESFATFSITEQIDQKDGFPYFKNYVGLSHLKDVSLSQSFSQLSSRVKKKVDLEEYLTHEYRHKDSSDGLDPEKGRRTTPKQIYWLNLIQGFSSETLNSHSQLFSFPKTNPDPFLSLSYKTEKRYQPSFKIQQFVKDFPKAPYIPKNTVKLAEVDKFLSTVIRPNTSIFEVEISNHSKDALILKMNNFDESIFHDNEGLDINAFCLQEAPNFPDPQPEYSDKSSGRSPESYPNMLTITSPISSGPRATFTGPLFEKKWSIGVQGPNYKSFGDRRENSTIMKSFSDQWDESHFSKKLYSHYRLRWARLENGLTLNAIVRSKPNKLLKRGAELSPNILEFEDVWKNLSVPPLLPLQTYFFPSEAELNDERRYRKLQYYINLTGDVKQKIDDFLDELVSQRLTLDFQLVDTESLDSYGRSSTIMHFNRFFRLSWGTVHHRIYLNSTDNLMCHIYTKKKERKVGNNTFNVDFFPTYYRYLLFNDRGKGLMRKSIIFAGIKQINWNKFDLYVSNAMKEEDFERTDLTNYSAKVISLILLPLYKNDQKYKKSPDVVVNFKKVMENLQEKLSEYGFKSELTYQVVKKRKELKALSIENEDTKIVKVYIGGQASGFNHFYFEYDKYFCPKVGFHFKVHWFSCAGSIIADLIRSMSTTARNADFSLKFIPNRYRILHAHPFESNIRINCKSAEIMKILRKLVQKPPFNFILDAFLSFTSFMHESGSVILYFFDNFLVWKENRLVDINIATPGDSDVTALCEKLFRNLIATIHCLEIIDDLKDKVIADISSQKSAE